MAGYASPRQTEPTEEMGGRGPEEDPLKDADEFLLNWGRYVHDSWLDHHLLYSVLPTSEGYIAPVRAFDETPPAKMPIDDQCGKLAEHVVIGIGCESGGFDHFQVLVHWYTRLIFLELTQEERLKRLSKRMHCNVPAAKRMLQDARRVFWDRLGLLLELRSLLAKIIRVAGE